MASIDSRHVHSSSGGMTAMAAGVPSLFYMQQMFWAFVGTAIGVATIANVLNMIIFRQRISASRQNIATPSKPSSLIFRSHASLSAIVREYSNYSFPVLFRNTRIYLPPLGGITIMLGYMVLIVVCTLYAFNTNDILQWEDIGYRAGFIAVAQLPLIVLIAGKRNIIGSLTGVGYERLTWLHRWVARTLFLTVLIHAGFWLSEWGKYDYIMVKIQEDPITQKGIAAGAILLWLMVSSVAPIRGLSYEFFVVQHVISWLGFIATIYLHVPAENQKWVWMPLAIWAFDRVARAVLVTYANLSLFHKNSSGVLSCRATFEPLDENHTRITINNPPVTWKAGQHMFLACHVVAPLSSHPFTIASLPEDGKMEFIVRAKKGATKRFFKYAVKAYPSLPTSVSPKKAGRSVLIDGPYARVRPLRQFDSLVLVAGSTGATFTMPLLRDVVQQWMGIGSSQRFSLEPPAGAVTRHIRFIWVVKKTSSINWFSSQLDNVVKNVETLRNQGHDIAVDISIYVTSDEGLTSSQSSITGVLNTQSAAQASPEYDEKDVITQRLSSASSSISFEKQNQVVDTRISIISGRPEVSNIIRKTAELALGEMAVVVCGPPGLVQCTRNAAVAISDERGVHKGTGAQGIYVHAETFGYA